MRTHEQERRYHATFLLTHPNYDAISAREQRLKFPERIKKNLADWHKKNPGFYSYSSMMTRCYNSKHERYKDYGGRGIAVCDRWKNNYVNFREDMGVRPAGMQIDRVNNNGNYGPDNCRWVTPKQNANNRRHK